MSKLRDAAQQALEALESAIPWIVTDRNTFAEVVRARHFQREDTETDESILSGYDAVIDDAEKATTALRAALAEQPAGPDAEPAIPPGYKLVPVEPTPAMLVAINWPNDPAGYRAMLAAAPEAPQPVKREPLTDEEICAALDIDGADDWTFKVAYAAIAAYERKNGGQP